MTRQTPENLQYYDHAVTDLMMEKYGWNRMEALRRFLETRTHEMLAFQDG